MPNEFLTDSEKDSLLITARESLNCFFSNSSYSIPTDGRLSESHGMFVTLKKNAALRGCIGYIKGFSALGNEAFDLARKAAFEDPRFPPLNENELKDLTIEISVLTPFEEISPEDVIVGEHGLYIKSGMNSGLLLPQVATEWGFDREQFLEAVCEKAWLSKDFWEKGDFKLYAFKAIVFSECKNA